MSEGERKLYNAYVRWHTNIEKGERPMPPIAEMIDFCKEHSHMTTEKQTEEIKRIAWEASLPMAVEIFAWDDPNAFPF